jgi:hypothetical protein
MQGTIPWQGSHASMVVLTWQSRLCQCTAKPTFAIFLDFLESMEEFEPWKTHEMVLQSVLPVMSDGHKDRKVPALLCEWYDCLVNQPPQIDPVLRS